MCGIAGELCLYRDSMVDESSIPAMLSVLNHRGPDEFGVHLSPDRRAALLHTRLSIVDLAGGR